MDFAISEDEHSLFGLAERFGDDRLRSAERTHEKEGAFPASLRGDFAALGLDRLGLSEAVGGSELPLSVRVGVWARLAKADPAAPIGLSAIPPGAHALTRSESGRKLLDAGRQGQLVVCGPDTQSIPWLPASTLDWLIRVDRDDVELLTSLTLTPTSNPPCGLKACGSATVHLSTAKREALGGAELAAECLSEARCFAAALMLGAAVDAHLAAAKYAQERIAFGQPIAHHQGLAFQLADCATEVEATRLLLEAAAARNDPMAIANAHALACRAAAFVAERSVQVLGGHGYLYDHRVEKRMRDIRSLAALYGGALLSERDAAESILETAQPLEFQS